ncbi:MAG: hypothetical protein JSV19_06900 [Phycisphaerales bacterium]|nr:MAG: hypothetical protein JSV19_06900 [Phycisphaerales bacterium]
MGETGRSYHGIMNDSADSRASDNERTMSAGGDGLPAIPADIYCQECGYDLRGLTSARCPECGRSLASLRSPDPQIPWGRRRELGWFRAYWSTVWMAIYRRRQLWEEMVRPVSYADSQRFRWITIAHAYVPILLGSLVLYGLDARRGPKGIFNNELGHELIAACWPLASVNVGFLMFMAAMTGVMSSFFHPRRLALEQQNRAVALSYYACAPVALSLIPLTLIAGALFVSSNHPVLGIILFTVGLVILVYLNEKWGATLVSFARRSTPWDKRRAVGVAIVFAALSVALWMACIVGLPLVVFYILVIITSLS